MVKLRNFFPRRKRIWLLWVIALTLLSLLIMLGPTKMTLSRANLKPDRQSAYPKLISEQTNLMEWKVHIRADMRRKLQENIYGYFPKSSATTILDFRVLDTNAYHGLGRIEEYTLTASASFNGIISTSTPFKMVVVIPNKMALNAPIILMESFCPNHNTVNHPKVSKPVLSGYSCDGGGFMSHIMLYVFGRYIATPPIEMILERGYAFATIFPSDFVPDHAITGQVALKALSQGHQDDNTRWGAIAAWSWGYSRMIDVLQARPEFENKKWIAYGHSRYAKAALVAGAFDERINGVISHQSGTGGASLNWRKKGESVHEITQSFPHWFSNTYQRLSDNDFPDIDQHALLALNAPHPIFLGNARRDVWSDPNGAFRAAQGASSIYKLYNKQGLNQNRLIPFKPNSDISFYLRPGTHGVVKEDWPAFLDFLDAHFNKK